MSYHKAYEAYAYRTSARFGSRVALSLTENLVLITGPRLSRPVYQAWIGVQVLCALLGTGALLASLLAWDWRLLVAAPVLFGFHLAVGGFGAGCLWELNNLIAFTGGSKGETVSFPPAAVRDIRVGAGWARRGMWLLLLPYVGGINQMAAGVCVSFLAPTDETGRDGVFALHMQTAGEADELARWLAG